MQAALEPRVRCLVADTLGVGIDELAPDVSLTDELAADSLDLAELAARLEAELGLVVPDRVVERLRTYGDLVRAAVAAAPERGAALAPRRPGAGLGSPGLLARRAAARGAPDAVCRRDDRGRRAPRRPRGAARDHGRRGRQRRRAGARARRVRLARRAGPGGGDWTRGAIRGAPLERSGLTRPETLSRVETEASVWRSVDRAQAVPRPAKPARQTLKSWAACVRRTADASPHSDAVTLRKVCRAGFCRPRHAVGPVHRAPLSLSPRPETESRVGLE